MLDNGDRYEPFVYGKAFMVHKLNSHCPPEKIYIAGLVQFAYVLGELPDYGALIHIPMLIFRFAASHATLLLDQYHRNSNELDGSH